MIATVRHFLVLVTAPDLVVARKLVRSVLKSRLAACANLVPRIESHYWWQGKLEVGAEVLILFKTEQAKLGELETRIRKRHPYDTPEFVVLPITGGSERYLDWIDQSIARPPA